MLNRILVGGTFKHAVDIWTIAMKPDQLFKELSFETSLEKRQQLIECGLQSGISPNEITEMLDYIDFCTGVKRQSAKRRSIARKKSLRTLGSFLQGLVCTFRLR